MLNYNKNNLFNINRNPKDSVTSISEVEIAHPAVHFATRLHDRKSDSDVSDMLYIILMRREVSLSQITT